MMPKYKILKLWHKLLELTERRQMTEKQIRYWQQQFQHKMCIILHHKEVSHQIISISMYSMDTVKCLSKLAAISMWEVKFSSNKILQFFTVDGS